MRCTTLLVLLGTTFFGETFSYWWKFSRLLTLESGLVSKRLTTRDFCSNFQWMTRAQMRKCRENPKAVIVVGQGTYEGLQECQVQFKNYRWNCTGQRTSWRLFEKMNKKLVGLWPRPLRRHSNAQEMTKFDLGPNILKAHEMELFSSRQELWLRKAANVKEENLMAFQGTREMSYLNAIASASAALAIARACSQGSLERCSCGQRNYIYRDSSVSEDDLYPWRGCQSHIVYGLRFSKDFLDPMSERRRQRSLRKLIAKQNNMAGREVYKSKLKPVCRCHGATGSCVTKACWQPLPYLDQVGEALRDRYKNAIEVRMNKRRTKLRAKRNRKYKIKPSDLVFTDSSPDFCEPNKDYGILGTHGRVCNKTGNSLNRCSILCCGRGYDTLVLRKTFRCHCKFKWCCSVHCKECTEERIEYRCK